MPPFLGGEGSPPAPSLCQERCRSSAVTCRAVFGARCGRLGFPDAKCSRKAGLPRPRNS